MQSFISESLEGAVHKWQKQRVPINQISNFL